MLSAAPADHNILWLLHVGPGDQELQLLPPLHQHYITGKEEAAVEALGNSIYFLPRASIAASPSP